jgi:hypothetical protein
MDRQTDGWTEGWMDGWIDRRMDGQKDGQKDGCIVSSMFGCILSYMGSIESRTPFINSVLKISDQTRIKLASHTKVLADGWKDGLTASATIGCMLHVMQKVNGYQRHGGRSHYPHYSNCAFQRLYVELMDFETSECKRHNNHIHNNNNNNAPSHLHELRHTCSATLHLASRVGQQAQLCAPPLSQVPAASCLPRHSISDRVETHMVPFLEGHLPASNLNFICQCMHALYLETIVSEKEISASNARSTGSTPQLICKHRQAVTPPNKQTNSTDMTPNLPFCHRSQSATRRVRSQTILARAAPHHASANAPSFTTQLTCGSNLLVCNMNIYYDD